MSRQERDVLRIHSKYLLRPAVRRGIGIALLIASPWVTAGVTITFSPSVGGGVRAAFSGSGTVSGSNFWSGWNFRGDYVSSGVTTASDGEISLPLHSPVTFSDGVAINRLDFDDDRDGNDDFGLSFSRLVSDGVSYSLSGSSLVDGISFASLRPGSYLSSSHDSGVDVQSMGIIVEQPVIALAGPPPKAERFTPATLPVRSSGASGLIFIAHGFNSSPFLWPQDLADSIEERLSDIGEADEWDIVTYDWSNAADVFPWTGIAASNAEQIGVPVGKNIDTLGYEKVHFIAHSAGAWLVDSASRQLDDDVFVSTTFLDAYTPNHDGADSLGEKSDWAEHYFSNRDLPDTDANLAKAFNVDISMLDPDVLFAVANGTTIGLVNGHQWPHEWYEQTAADPLGVDSRGWGFGVSQEEGNLPSHDQYERGNGISLGPIGPPVPAAAPVSFGEAVNFEAVPMLLSETGTATADSTQMTLETGSPVWSTMLITLDTAKSWLAFGFEFGEGSGGDGLFAIYWDDAVIGTFDERYVRDGRHEYLLELGQLGDEGTHFLSLRLDSFSDASSKATLSNVRFGAEPVPLPGTVFMLASGLVCLRFAKPRMRRPLRATAGG